VTCVRPFPSEFWIHGEFPYLTIELTCTNSYVAQGLRRSISDFLGRFLHAVCDLCRRVLLQLLWGYWRQSMRCTYHFFIDITYHSLSGIFEFTAGHRWDEGCLGREAWAAGTSRNISDRYAQAGLPWTSDMFICWVYQSQSIRPGAVENINSGACLASFTYVNEPGRIRVQLKRNCFCAVDTDRMLWWFSEALRDNICFIFITHKKMCIPAILGPKNSYEI
jgi:hypothetical protein